MNFLEKLDALKAITGDSNASLSKKSGIPYTTIDGLYKKGYSNMKLSTLQALADYFRVSIDYLAKDNYDSPEQINHTVSPDDKTLLGLYNSLSPENRVILSAIAQTLYNIQNDNS